MAIRGRLVKPNVVAALVGILGVISLVYVYGTRLHYPPIRSDGVGYYLYLPAAVIDGDLTLRLTIAKHFNWERPDWAGVKEVPGSDRLLIKYPMGEAILLAPFFLAAHVLTTVTGAYKADGFTPLYQAAGALAGLAYLIAGLEILRRLLQKSFSPAITFWTLVVMVFGTNLFHYGTLDSIFSHAFSFFLFALFLYRVEQWYTNPTVRSTAILALVAGLITLVRPTNSLVFVYALLFGITDRSTSIERGRFLRNHAHLLLAGAAMYAMVLSPQVAYWRYITGDWFVYAYQGETFRFSSPEILNVLFSVRKGLFFWSPVLMLAVVGFFWMRKYKPSYMLATALFLPLNAYVISSWADWAYGGSFGHRAFVDSIAVFAFGYASLLQAARRPAVRRIILTASLILVFLSVWMMLKYWMHEIPFDGTTWPQFVSALPLAS